MCIDALHFVPNEIMREQAKKRLQVTCGNRSERGCGSSRTGRAKENGPQAGDTLSKQQNHDFDISSHPCLHSPRTMTMARTSLSDPPPPSRLDPQSCNAMVRPPRHATATLVPDCASPRPASLPFLHPPPPPPLLLHPRLPPSPSLPSWLNASPKSVAA